jgi:hypothetical protein
MIPKKQIDYTQCINRDMKDRDGINEPWCLVHSMWLNDFMPCKRCRSFNIEGVKNENNKA